MEKEKQIFVPSRASESLIQLVNRQRKKDGHTWPELVTTLFHGYLKYGVPVLNKRRARGLRSDEN